MSQTRRTADFAIIGGGIIGLSIALELAGHGHSVVVLDRSTPGAAASSRNGGGVRQQGRAVPEIGLAVEAVNRWESLADRWGGPTGYRQIGHLYVAMDDDQMAQLRKNQAIEADHGLETELVDAATIGRLAPGLKGGYVGGKLCATDGVAIPALTMQTLVSAARRAGVELISDQGVHSVRTSRGAVVGVDAGSVSVDAPVVVNAAGPWSSAIAALADVFVPVLPSRLHMFRTQPIDMKFADVWVAMAALDFNASQWEDGSLMFGGAYTPDAGQYTFDLTPNPQNIAEAMHKLGESVPGLAGTPLQAAWTGIREFTPDMIPIIGPAPGLDGFFLCTGFSGHGFALGPHIGELVGDWLASGPAPAALAPFAIERFQTDTSPFNFPPAPWGGATTTISAMQLPELAPLDLATVPLTDNSGFPTMSPAPADARP
jgi:sarcosine oxidase subunit beta